MTGRNLKRPKQPYSGELGKPIHGWMELVAILQGESSDEWWCRVVREYVCPGLRSTGDLPPTCLTAHQVSELAELYEWTPETAPIYDRRIIHSRADPETTREFYQILKDLEGHTDRDSGDLRCAIEQVRKSLPPVEPPVKDFLALFQSKTLPAEHYILRAIENGISISAVFTVLGFN